MSANETSIFSLSPAEKLQLVEDLWDDLAASPSDVPVHEWQKVELESRKERMKNAPPVPLSWEEIKQHARERQGR